MVVLIYVLKMDLMEVVAKIVNYLAQKKNVNKQIKLEFHLDREKYEIN
jgi:anti-sigma regulatory factor (Ser/Thr protein kinase)